MRLGTHVAGGVLAYAAVATLAHLPVGPGPLAACAFAAALPDVDTLGSTVGRVFAPLARRIEKRWGHRTLTHSYAAQIAVALLAASLLAFGHAGYFAAITVGYASHPFLDTMTVQGVRLFWPVSDRRCVFPFYARQPLRYRTRTGSKADSALGAAFAALFVPVFAVHTAGYERVVRRVQASPEAAARDFADLSPTHLVAADVDARDAATGRTLRGRFEVLGTPTPGALVVRDPASGAAYALGRPVERGGAPFEGRIVAVKGAPVTVRPLTVDFAGRSLADLDALVPRTASGARVRHLLDGTLRLADPLDLPADPARFATASAAGGTLRLRYATAGELDAAGLLGRSVRSGSVVLRLYLGADDVGAPRLAARPIRHVAHAYAPDDPPRPLVREGQPVRAGDTLAVLHPARRAEALAALGDARTRRALLAAPTPTAPAARARLAEAHAALDRALAEVAAGFAVPAAAGDERADVRARAADVGVADARDRDATRAAHVRRLEVDAAVRAAEARLATLDAAGALVAPTAATVVRVETATPAPDRHELRIVLRPR